MFGLLPGLANRFTLIPCNERAGANNAPGVQTGKPCSHWVCGSLARVALSD
jgi:hypothetical protein